MERKDLILIVILIGVLILVVVGLNGRSDFSPDGLDIGSDDCKGLHDECDFTGECCPGLECVSEDNEEWNACKKKDGESCESHLDCGPHSACCRYTPIDGSSSVLVCAPYPNIDPDYYCDPIIDGSVLGDEQQAKINNIER